MIVWTIKINHGIYFSLCGAANKSSCKKACQQRWIGRGWTCAEGIGRAGQAAVYGIDSWSSKKSMFSVDVVSS